MLTRSQAGGGRDRRGLGIFALAALVLVVAAPTALGRDAFVANSGSASVSVFDAGGGGVLGGPIAVGSNPGGIAIAPDGTRVYVADYGSDTVSVIDSATREVVGEPIAVGDGPRGVAMAPDGSRVYVSNEISGTVSVIDTATNKTVGLPIAVGTFPLGVAITPDGKRLYVANEGPDTVSVIITESNETFGLPIPVGSNPLAIAITPDGSRAYVTNRSSGTVSVIDTATDTVVDTITLGSSFLIGIAISPDGRRGYVAQWEPGRVSVFDTASNDVVGEPVLVGSGPFGIAVSPDGKRVLVANSGSESVSVIDTAIGKVVGGPTMVGTNPYGVAIVPDQPPVASLAAVATGTAGRGLRFDASASSDPDGQVSRYDWSFGDGQTALDAGPTPTHTYGAPGTYPVTVTLTDSEGCSTELVFTGLTASCNGSPVARATIAVKVESPPVVDRPPPACLSNAFRIRGVQRNRQRGTATLSVRVPCPGALSMRGRKVRAVKREVERDGVFTLVARAKVEKLKALKRRGRLAARVAIAFRPEGGVARTRARGLTLVRRR